MVMFPPTLKSSITMMMGLSNHLCAPPLAPLEHLPSGGAETPLGRMCWQPGRGPKGRETLFPRGVPPGVGEIDQPAWGYR